MQPYFLLTTKKVLAVVNLGEDELGRPPTSCAPVADEWARRWAEVLGVSVQLEAEAAPLDDDERTELLDGLGLGEGALPRLVRTAYHLLGLRTFLTTGDKESRAWTFRAGAKAPECAGVIHSDLQRGFIRAEVIRWDQLLEIGSWNKAKERASSGSRARTTRSSTATSSRSASTCSGIDEAGGDVAASVEDTPDVDLAVSLDVEDEVGESGQRPGPQRWDVDS